MILRTLILLALALSTQVRAQSDEEPTVSVTPIKDGLFLLQGRGGNVVASEGEDGMLLVDDDYPQYQPAYLQAVKALGADGVRFIVNTHWHGDHTGGNAAWGESGSMILAHDNVRQRLSTRQDIKAFNRMVEAAPISAWPLVTFADSLALHVNGETVEVQHFPQGHTDGDSMVFFVEANVVHTGDHYFKDRFPFVDIGSGGSVGGLIDNIRALLSRVDYYTVIVPGHGDLANQEDLARFYNMLVETREEVRSMQARGMDLAAMQAAGLDAKWDSWGSGFINAERWISFIATSPR